MAAIVQGITLANTRKYRRDFDVNSFTVIMYNPVPSFVSGMDTPTFGCCGSNDFLFTIHFPCMVYTDNCKGRVFSGIPLKVTMPDLSLTDILAFVNSERFCLISVFSILRSQETLSLIIAFASGLRARGVVSLARAMTLYFPDFRENLSSESTSPASSSLLSRYQVTVIVFGLRS